MHYPEIASLKGAPMAEKIRVVRDRDGFEIIANREGLVGLAIVCLQLGGCQKTTKEPNSLETTTTTIPE